MASVDERVVAMSFENTKFEARVAATMSTLSKLDAAIKNVGQTSGLSKIEADANKVTLNGPMSALDKLKTKLGFSKEAPRAFSDLENAANKVGFTGPSSALDKLKAKLGFREAPQAFSDLENAANKVGFTGPSTALDKLKSKLNFGREGAQAFAELEGSSEKVSFSGVSRAIDGISSKFSVMQIAAGVAFGNIATTAIQKLGGLANSLSLGPITQGFQEYATNLNSIQTILANTKDSGGNLQKVNAALQDLNKYSDQTIYNFGQMARNIGTFTAAGVRLGPATEAIKGIANLAALSGSNSEQASTAMYQLSQAIASGKVGLQDWNSVVNAGMGGAVFQKALMRTASNMGTLAEGAVKIDKATGKATVQGQSFRDSIAAKPGEKSWLTSEVLVNTLKQFTGDLSDAALKAQGFSDAQVKLIQEQARTAKKAATEVKTLSGVFDVVKESIGSGWSAVFQNIFGNFNESKKTFTGLSTFITSFVSKTFGAFNSVLAEWKKLGGRTELIKGIQAAFSALLGILKPIKDAFQEIFPAKSGKELFEMTQNFTKLMQALKPGEATMRNLKRIFAGLFAVLHIGWSVVKDVVTVIGDLLGVAGKSSGGFLTIAGNVGDFLVALDKSLTSGNLLLNFFKGLGPVLRATGKLLKTMAEEINALFSGISPGGLLVFAGSMDDMNKATGPLVPVMEGLSNAWDSFLRVMGKVNEIVGPTIKKIGDTLATFGEVAGDAIAHANFDAVFAAINSILLGGILFTLRKGFTDIFGKGLAIDLGGGVLKNLSDTFGALTGNLKAMQRNVQAKTLFAIAGAILVLAAGVAILATINPKKLGASMTAIAVGMGELVAAMAILNKAAGGTAFLRMPFIAGSMVILAGAMIIMAGAVKIFSTMSKEELAKGLAGVGGSLLIIMDAVRSMPPAQLRATATGLLPIAASLKLIASVAKDFAAMSWREIARGLVGISGSLVGIGLAMNAFPSNTLVNAVGLVAIAFALTILSGAVAGFGGMDLETLIQGIWGIAASLVAIGFAIETIPPTLALQAAGLLILGVALTAISAAVAIFGSMKLGTLVKGILGMGAALVVLGAGLTSMAFALPGAAALLVAAAAFDALIPALAVMGTMPWHVILKGLGAMALTLGVLAVVGVLVAGPLIALGAALVLLGVGITTIGAGVYLLAKALSIISTTGIKAFAALLAAGALFIAAFPKMVIDFVKGIIVILDQVVQLAPKIISALINIVGQLLDAIVRLAPKAAVAISALITQILIVLQANAQPIIQAGFQLLINLLAGLANNIGPITDRVSDIIANFLNALAANMPKITEAGTNLIISFLTGITVNIPKIAAAVSLLMVTFLANITKHIPKIIGVAGTLMAQLITSILAQVPKLVVAGLNAILNFVQGISKAIPRVINTAIDVGERFVRALAKGLLRLVDFGFTTIIKFLNKLADTIRNREPQLIRAGMNVAFAIVQGMFEGFKQIVPKLMEKVGEIVHGIVNKAKDILKVWSPSRVFMDIGKNVALGLSVGIEKNGSVPIDAISTVAADAIDAAKAKFDTFPDLMAGLVDTQPVITPVLDLSDVKKNAPKLTDMMAGGAITPTTSIDQASAISGQALTLLDSVPWAQPPSIRFEQNNYSPESLSNIEIYRQTNNQLSKLKSLVAV